MYEREIAVIKALAEGVNYFTGEKAQNDSVLNDVELIRTLYRVYDILKSVTPEKVKKQEFVCPFDLEEKFPYEDELTITGIRSKIAAMYPDLKMFSYKQARTFLTELGLLTKELKADGKYRTVATEEANKHGIYTAQRLTMYNQTYTAIVYNREGQRYFLSLLKQL